MAEFKLPSGRIVETHEPTYGEECDAIFAGLTDNKEFHYAKFAAVVPNLTREDIQGLARMDGRALAAEVNRIFLAKPEGSPPLGNGSPSPSTGSSLQMATKKRRHA
jgi:hypothetical protein